MFNDFFFFVCHLIFISSFGKRSGVSVRRPNECLILEPSEMLVVSFPKRNIPFSIALHLQFLPLFRPTEIIQYQLLL